MVTRELGVWGSRENMTEVRSSDLFLGALTGNPGAHDVRVRRTRWKVHSCNLVAFKCC